MGVCCIVFDFFMNFLNIEKNKILRICVSIFHVFFAFHSISNIKKKNWCKKKIRGGGGGGCWIFFLEKQFSLISRFMLFSTLKKNIEKCPFTIVDRDSWNLYPLYPLFPCSDFVSQIWGWFGGGGDVFLTFYAISNISRTQNLGIQNNYFSFNVFFVFFFVCWKYWKVPLHLQLLVKWEVVSPNSRYREFYHEIGNI